MLKLRKSLTAWNRTEFNSVLKNEIQCIEPQLLPLQKGLSFSSYVSNSPFNVVILSFSEIPEYIQVKAGIFYTGIISGCSCSDDPSPVDEQNEYCEVQLNINKKSAETEILLSKE